MPINPARYYEVLRVFIACPGDLVAERSRFPRVLETVNVLKAHGMGFHLEAVGWERVVPSFGRPQDLINQELFSADLTLVVFWNRIGFPTGADDRVTGTVEEFEIAKKRCGYGQDRIDLNEVQRPSLYVYFRTQTEPETDSASKVRDLRKAIEDERQLLYRQYGDESEWERLVTEHLVAFLNGRRRTDIEKGVETLPPIGSIMRGRFYWQCLYPDYGVTKIEADFDGDDADEEVTFRFQQTQHWITFAKTGCIGYEIAPSGILGDWENGARLIHLAIKDVTNDGVPELLVAADRGDAFVQLSVFGMRGDAFVELAVLDGQRRIYVYENGHIVMPYGSVGLYWDYRWDANTGIFEKKELHDPLRLR
jgi:hypothetical protein